MLRLKTLFRLLRRLVVLVCIAAVLLMALPPLAREADRLLYPRKYSRQVEQTLKGFPYNQMHHYVEKITASYAVYTRLYGG